MNTQETLSLLDALRAAGATHFKSHDFEVTFGKAHDRATGSTQAPNPPNGANPDPGPAAVGENKEATEKLKALVETMKLDDVSLLNKIFPNGAEN